MEQNEKNDAAKGEGLPRVAGIIGAEQQEVDLLCERLEGAQKAAIAGIDFHSGTLCGESAVIARCGIGKVNAGLCVQIMADRFGATRIINTGSAGGTAEGLSVLDMVACTDAVQHDMDVTGLGYAAGQVPGVPVFSFAADAKMRAAALQVFAGFDRAFYERLEAEDAQEASVFSKLARLPIIKEGRVTSGDTFVCDDSLRGRIIATFAPACVEMEGAAVAQAAWANGIPFLVLRSISDMAGSGAHLSYEDFSRLASRISAAVVLGMMEKAGEWL